MIFIGILCLIVGYLLPLHLLVTIGVILIILGAILLAASFVDGSPVYGRRYW